MPKSITDLPEDIIHDIARSNGLLYQTCKPLFEMGLPVTFRSLYGAKVCLEDADEEQFAEHVRFLAFIMSLRNTPKAWAVNEVCVNLEAPDIPKMLFRPDLEICPHLEHLVNLQRFRVSLADFGSIQRLPFFDKLKSLYLHVRVPTGATTPEIARWIYLKYPNLEHIRVFRNMRVDDNDDVFWDLYEDGLVACMRRMNWKRRLITIVFVTNDDFYNTSTWDLCGFYDNWSFNNFYADGTITREANVYWNMALTKPDEKFHLFDCDNNSEIESEEDINSHATTVSID